MSESGLINLVMGSNESAISRSFSFQYTSLILIILTFVTGAFQRRGDAEVPKPTHTVQIAESSSHTSSDQEQVAEALARERSFTPTSALSQNLDLSAVIDESWKIVPNGALEAIVSVLKSHDVRGEFEINVHEEFLRNGLAVGSAIRRLLEAKGVPQGVADVFVVGSEAVPDSKVRFVARITSLDTVALQEVDRNSDPVLEGRGHE